jgi:hypothetical protein
VKGDLSMPKKIDIRFLTLILIGAAVLLGGCADMGWGDLGEIPDLSEALGFLNMPDMTVLALPEVAGVEELPGEMVLPEMPELGELYEGSFSLICIPEGVELPEGYGPGIPVCEEGQLPIELPDEPPEALKCIPGDLEIPFELPQGWDLPTCGPDEFPVEIPDPPEHLICIPEEVELPENFPWNLPTCGPDEFPWELGDPPEGLKCIPADVELPENFPWDLRTCEEGELPIEIPPELLEMISCIPGGVELPYNLPPELEALPICAEGELPFELPELPELPDGFQMPVFSDVSENGETFNAIQRLYHEGFVAGKGDGSFGASDLFTRGEAAVVISRIGSGVDVIPDDVESRFTDDGGWVEKWAGHADKFGFMNGYLDETFQPNEAMTLAEVLVIGIRGAEGMGFTPPDVPESSAWFEKWFVYAEGLGIDLDSSLADLEITRELAMQIIADLKYNP